MNALAPKVARLVELARLLSGLRPPHGANELDDCGPGAARGRAAARAEPARRRLARPAPELGPAAWRERPAAAPARSPRLGRHPMRRRSARARSRRSCRGGRSPTRAPRSRERGQRRRPPAACEPWGRDGERRANERNEAFDPHQERDCEPGAEAPGDEMGSGEPREPGHRSTSSSSSARRAGPIPGRRRARRPSRMPPSTSDSRGSSAP